MKPFPRHARRESVAIAVISALALAPLLFLALKRGFGPVPTAHSTATVQNLPVLTRLWLDGDSHPENHPDDPRFRLSYVASIARLSPDGRWIARMEGPLPVSGTAAPASAARTLDDLVIRASSNGQEIFREPQAGRFMGWVPQSNAFVTLSGLDVSIWTPTPRKRLAASPGSAASGSAASGSVAAWTARLLSLLDNSSALSGYSSGGQSITELEHGVIAFSPDFRYAVKATWDKGPVWWSVADLSTGKIAAPVQAGRWLGYDPINGASSSEIVITVAPASRAAGGPPVVALLQSTEMLVPTPTPLPTPTPTPQPTPTATPNAAQSAFLARSQREEAEIQTLVEKVLGIDGADPEVSDPVEAERIGAEVKRRNRALQTERDRLFPVPTYVPVVHRPPVVTLNDAKPFQVDCFDLSTPKRLWGTSVQGSYQPPRMRFSSDRQSLVLWGTERLNPQTGGAFLTESGLDFFDSLTGQGHSAFRRFDFDFDTSSPDQVKFTFDLRRVSHGQRHSMAVFLDRYQNPRNIKNPTSNPASNPFRQTLRFFDTTTRREAGHLDLDTGRFPKYFQNQIRDVSPDDNGIFWLIGEADYALTSRSQLGAESASALPTPTSVPTATPIPAVPPPVPR